MLQRIFRVSALASMLLSSIFSTAAADTDYYVATAAVGTGDGSSSANAATYANLATKVNGYSSTDPLDVYFLPGTYSLSSSSSVLTIPNAVTVNFMPFNSHPTSAADSVAFDFGSASPGGAHFLYLSVSGARVSLSGVELKNFKDGGADEAVNNSLFDIVPGASLSVENCYIANISSGQNPLVCGRPGITSFKNCNITDVTANTYAIYNKYGDGGMLSFDHCRLSNWASANGTYGTFYLDEDGQLSITNSKLSHISSGADFIMENQANGAVSLSGDTIDNVTAGESFIDISAGVCTLEKTFLSGSSTAANGLFYAHGGGLTMDGNSIHDNTIASSLSLLNVSGASTVWLGGNSIYNNTDN
ncbi:MAG: hypothetical protein LBL81_03855, partial [Tannerella sp.]|nr:hypothetical protein [Tannerella sp.]